MIKMSLKEIDNSQYIQNILFDFYGIDDVSLKRTEEGLQNENYIVTTDDGMKFILKKRIKQVYDDEIEVEREKNIAAIVYQISKKLSFVIAPRVNAKGSLITQSNGGVYLLYKYCSGNHEDYENKEIVRQIGYAISQFHNESKRYVDKCIIKTDKSFENHLDMMKKNKLFYDSYISEIVQGFEETYQDVENTTTKIHADLTPSNVIFLNKKLNGIIDFDNIRVSSREEEIIRFLTSISDKPELVYTFLKQYQDISTDSLNLTDANIRYFVYKDLIEEAGIWYEKIKTKNFVKDISFYTANLANTIKRMYRVEEIIKRLASVVNEISICKEER